ncbi:MAG: NTP transferase domain-containing protein [Syntrophomonadaceae bacterium]|nr:NTP transferase domain-containing protein [Syntrophomonadaceae bacterium]
MQVEHIIVQAGGKGTRMEHLTRNKPKALVPVNNLPMLFHLFRKYPSKKYIIIGDYKCDVLEKYLAAFAEVDYKVVNASGASGTCAGLREATGLLPENEAFMLIWSDLILPEEFELPTDEGCYVGVSKDFRCRWSYVGGSFREEPSESWGVAGLFVFEDKSLFEEVPVRGEFVRWLSMREDGFKELPLWKTKEYGLLSEYSKLPTHRCRPFNRITFEDDYIIKKGIDEQGQSLATREVAWYRRLRGKDFKNIPKIFEYQPLKMERIHGKNIFEYELSTEEKKAILRKIVACLKEVQALERVPSDERSYKEAYVGKTFERLRKVYELIPFAKDEYVVINGKKCPNVFYRRSEIERLCNSYFPKEFKLIHGDCTFSNTMLRDGTEPVLIDPRGYFGFTEFFGDPAYDWAKLYYSIVGNYDQFNLKRFRLNIRESDVLLDIASNHWEDMEDEFFCLLEGEVTRPQIKLLHAIIWLSLTTYAWEDYDSICGAFYIGLKYLEEVI